MDAVQFPGWEIVGRNYSKAVVADNSQLGILSSKYESNGDPGAISNYKGDAGGKSYGAYKLSTNMDSVDEFLIWLSSTNPSYYQQLINAKIKMVIHMALILIIHGNS